MKYIVSTMALFSLAVLGCTGSDTGTNTTTGALESCFATSGGQMRCVATPGGVTKGARDVDGDGTADTFVCSNNEAGSRCDCAKLGCRDLRQSWAGAGGREGTCDGGRASGEYDGGQTWARGEGGSTGTSSGDGEGDMICPPSATGSGGSGAAGATGAAGAGGATGAGGAIIIP
jgi:hypothetical protein